MASFLDSLMSLFGGAKSDDAADAVAQPAASPGEARYTIVVPSVPGDADNQIRSQLLGVITAIGGIATATNDGDVGAVEGSDPFAAVIQAQNRALKLAQTAKADAALWAAPGPSGDQLHIYLAPSNHEAADRIAFSPLCLTTSAAVGGELTAVVAVWFYQSQLSEADRPEEREYLQSALNGWMAQLKSHLPAIPEGGAAINSDAANCGMIYALGAEMLGRDAVRGHIELGASWANVVANSSFAAADPALQAAVMCLSGELQLRQSLSSAGEELLELARTQFVQAEEIYKQATSSALALSSARFGLARAMVMMGRSRDDIKLVLGGLQEMKGAAGSLKSAREPYQWATVMGELGRGLAVQAEMEGRKKAFKASAEFLLAARKVMPKAKRPYDWAQLSYALGSSWFMYGRVVAEPSFIEQAKMAFTDASSTFEDYGAHRSARSAEGNAFRCDSALDEAVARKAAGEGGDDSDDDESPGGGGAGQDPGANSKPKSKSA